MPNPPPFPVRVSNAARRDVAAALRWSQGKFGSDASRRYKDLLAQAFADIGDDPERPGARQRPDLAQGILVYPIAFSRARARSDLGVVRNPRHLVVYRRSRGVIEVIRVLHDARDIQRHLAQEHRAGAGPTIGKP